MKHKSAAAAIQAHLTRYKQLDQFKCIERYGTWRLSHYIYQLRRRGWNIETENKTVTTRFGIKTDVANYKLISHP